MNFKDSIFILATLGWVACVGCSNSLQVTPELSVTDGSLGIYDGKPTTIQKHPYLVSLQIKRSNWCAASIVSSQWVLTIGACAYGFPNPGDLDVVAASNDGKTGEIYKVKKIVLHPKYIDGNLDYDYAVCKIKGEFKWSDKIKPIKLGTKQPKPGTKFSVAGYGSTAPPTYMPLLNNEVEKSRLLEGTLYWLPKKQCVDVLKAIKVPWTPRLACAYNQGKTTLCEGDWADALVYKGAVYGIFAVGVSQGFCSYEAYPVGLADVPAVAPWIKKITGAKYDYE
ncbi:trypsin-7-like [Homalodisca vitripennis]|uniref:trypsin-7-like n=1 Tax=Homalodisca vitripennis TaxID=197043 RepID=UPI001EE9B4E1|nr:trypsin-7-like [Homalodisca vitripennis]